MAPARYESRNVSATPLAEPLHFPFSGKTAPNRFLKAAMTERLSSWDPTDKPKRGIPSKNLINVYRRWGEGRVGLILTGNIMIDYDQLEAMGNPIIPPDADTTAGERFEAFRELAKVSKAHGALCVGQVSHPGRQVEERINPNPVSASDVQLEGTVMGMNFAKPREASSEDISNIIQGFAHAAEFLDKAGYDGIQLHGAHGYLLAQFFSNTTNLRKDEYGGSMENRARLTVDIAREVRKRVSDGFMLGIKLNSVEFQAGGLQPEEAKELCKILEKEKFDFVELSGGTYEELAFMHKKESTKKREAFFLEFADLIVPTLQNTKAYVTGGFKTVGAMVDALDTVQGVGLARPICQEPNICRDILEGKVQGAISQLFDTNNFGLTNVVAGSQIRQIGKDLTPIDGSDPENAKAFEKDMQKWMSILSNDTQMKHFGYVDIDSVPEIPYGTAGAVS